MNPNTSKAYKSALRCFEKVTGLPLADVLQGRVAKSVLISEASKWEASMTERGMKNSTIRARLTALRSMLDVDIPLPEKVDEARVSLSIDDLRRLVESIPHTHQGEQDRALIAALIFVQRPLPAVLSASWAEASLHNWPAPVLDHVGSLRARLGSHAPRLDQPIFFPITDRYTRLTGSNAHRGHISQQEVSRRLRKYGERLGLTLTARDLRIAGRELLSHMGAHEAAERIGLIQPEPTRRTLNQYRDTKNQHRRTA